jgi:hypothetical protein
MTILREMTFTSSAMSTEPFELELAAGMILKFQEQTCLFNAGNKSKKNTGNVPKNKLFRFKIAGNGASHVLTL